MPVSRSFTFKRRPCLRRAHFLKEGWIGSIVLALALPPLHGQSVSTVREVEFRYDSNNNATGVKPPSRDWHTFGYDITDNLASYQPPVLPGVSVVNTTYGYNLHPKLTSVMRPVSSVWTIPAGDCLRIPLSRSSLSRIAISDIISS